jgi:capsular polysaccharide export protein
MGPFFAKLAKTLREHGQRVVKVNFNAGDDYFFDEPGVVRFTAPMTDWPAFVRSLLVQYQMDAVAVFGQMRDMHRHAIEVARELGVTVYVFEEGYIRPDYVTLEVGGVNAESGISRDPQFYRSAVIEPMPLPKPTGQEFRTVAELAMTYALAMWRGQERYPHYVHHRCLRPVTEGLKWVRGAWRKWRHGVAEQDMLPMLTHPAQHKRFFLVPLQVYNDSQIRCHSRFVDVAEFIANVIESFAQHAPADKLLVLKHHPLDRPYNNYRFLITELAREWGVTGRVHYIHDQHLPTLLRHACGVVTVNSTTGLQALFHNTPVIALGECFYGVPGLVNTGELADFWSEPGTVDRELFSKFRHHLIRETQLNASFYAGTPGLPSYSETCKRLASSGDKPMPDAQASAWSPSTFPTLK